MAGRNRNAGKHGARRPQRAEEKAFRRATLAGMMFKARWPNRVRSFREKYRGDRTAQEVGPEDSFLSPDHSSFLSAPEGIQGVPQIGGDGEPGEEDDYL
jgi:hypothetical protein